MDWLKELLQLLPLEQFSEILAKIVLVWIRLVDGVPEEQLAFYTYVGGCFLVLFLFYFALRLIPKMFRGIIWVMSVAILLTPGATINDTGGTAPAIIEVLHAFIMGEPALAIAAFLPILAVIIVGLILGGIWQLLRAATTKTDGHHA